MQPGAEGQDEGRSKTKTGIRGGTVPCCSRSSTVAEGKCQRPEVGRQGKAGKVGTMEEVSLLFPLLLSTRLQMQQRLRLRLRLSYGGLRWSG